MSSMIWNGNKHEMNALTKRTEFYAMVNGKMWNPTAASAPLTLNADCKRLFETRLVPAVITNAG